MTQENEHTDSVEGLCPLLELPCPSGEQSAWQCWVRVHGNFDPVSSFDDWCILECARERAEKLRNRSTKFCF
ncbi:hypothetical protein GWO43_07135 [candidate division KSB1 bacterium]|nr:hypothetical protein [candidate division KSB1 bacterium]NIX70339.1 hypothetical protein [candidate division KSB1 bacterium]